MQEIQTNSKETIVTHDMHDGRHYGAVTHPIYQNSLFTFETHEELEEALAFEVSSIIYTRGNNPTVRALEERLAELEGGEEARCFASGMAAISAAVLSTVQAGDHIVCVDGCYGPARRLMEEYLVKFQIDTTFVDGKDLLEAQNAVRPNTRLIYLESPTSMLFELQDLEQFAALAKKIGAKTIIDGSWASPCFQSPLSHGIDMVVHSMTKYISGHSDLIGGVVIGAKQHLDQLFRQEFQLFGGILHPQSANLFMRGLRTLPLRMHKLQENGLKVAHYLENQSFIIKMNHPGLKSHPQHELYRSQMSGSGSLFSFETHIPMESMRCWANQLQYFRKGISWGGFESLVYMRNQPDNRVIVRLYVGLEEPDDLINDLKQAFASIEA
ncbi:L-alanine/L-glutamate racemase [Paenibacillus allorhizoplanae]|uniref:L-alanine/L-glutamate racemase n=1 Tax=Paenibacillus allorhizoplanae TaxID=2905648 RepID=A0ABN8GK57_9BACL|nr:PLP-dependent aspartate aminotransferase family protein [Paenibacillus allorhizoplanae]CAH1211055.1 L-alanine/L-glutamate racemase [Paenibacillus allorhizoplanae]